MPTLRLHRDTGTPLEAVPPRSLVGRDPGCDLVIDDRSISRRHVAFELRGTTWMLVDQGSANGSYLDGKRVSEAALRDGQTVRLGSLVLRVQIESDAPATVLMARPDLGESTVVMARPEAPPDISTVEIQVPSLAPPVVKPPARPAAPPPAPPVVAPPVAPRLPARAPAPSADPWQVLGLAPGSDAAAVRARYEQASADLRQRVAQAPTPALRATDEKNLRALEQALHELVPAAAAAPAPPEDYLRDLPAARPTVDAELLEKADHSRRAAAETPAAPDAAAPARGRASLPPIATTLLVFLATGLLALCAFFALASGKLKLEIRKEEEAPELVAARQAAAKLLPFEELLKNGALRNGRLKLCNRSSRPLAVGWLSAVSVQKDELPAGADPQLAALAHGFRLVTYNSGFCGRDFAITLPPGGEQAVELRSEEARCRFDGSAVFFALSVQRPADPVPEATPPAGKKGAAPPEPEEERPGDPGTTTWVSGLLAGNDACVPLGAGW